MSMPPADISAADLWAQITAAPRPHRIVPFPMEDKDGKPICHLAMVVLTQEEEMLANACSDKAIRQKLQKTGGTIPNKNEQCPSFTNMLELQCGIETLWLCCKDANDLSKPFFRNKEDIGKLTKDRIAVLLRHYIRVQDDLGPIVSKMSEMEMNAWIDRLVEGGAEYPLDYLSLVAASELMMFMAFQLCILRKDKSLQLQPLEDITEVI